MTFRHYSSSAIILASLSVALPAYATTGCNAAGWDLGFSDVRGCTSSYPAIDYLTKNNIVQGYPDHTFGPEKTINRAEFTKILMGVKSTAEERANCLGTRSLFPDVPKNAWYAPYVCVAKQRGIIDGYDDGMFRPAQQINYAEAAKIAANAYGLSIPPKDQYDPRWYSPYAHALSEKNATPPTIEQYDDPLTRGEMSELIYRLETGKTSLEWFGSIPDGDDVFAEEISGSPAGVSFSFPGSLFSAKTDTVSFRDMFASDRSRGFPGIRLTHAYQGEGCSGMAGYDAPCRPAGTEIALAVGMVDRPVEYIKMGFGEAVTQDGSTKIVDGREAFTYWEGVECEGYDYTAIPADATHTLMIVRTIDCNDHARGPDFLSREKQNELLQNFLDSIHIDTPYVTQTAPVTQITVWMCAKQGSSMTRSNDPTVPVSYTIPKTSTVADSLLRVLFHSYNGKGEAEGCEGVSSLDYFYRGVTITNGVATVKLSKPFHEIFADDSQNIYANSARRSVEANLKQFPAIMSVVFSPQ